MSSEGGVLTAEGGMILSECGIIHSEGGIDAFRGRHHTFCRPHYDGFNSVPTDSNMIYGRSRTASYRGGLTGEANGHHWGGILDDWGGNCHPS